MRSYTLTIDDDGKIEFPPFRQIAGRANDLPNCLVELLFGLPRRSALDLDYQGPAPGTVKCNDIGVALDRRQILRHEPRLPRSYRNVQQRKFLPDARSIRNHIQLSLVRGRCFTCPAGPPFFGGVDVNANLPALTRRTIALNEFKFDPWLKHARAIGDIFRLRRLAKMRQPKAIRPDISPVMYGPPTGGHATLDEQLNQTSSHSRFGRHDTGSAIQRFMSDSCQPVPLALILS
jgi:hypothetical protein